MKIDKAKIKQTLNVPKRVKQAYFNNAIKFHPNRLRIQFTPFNDAEKYLVNSYNKLFKDEFYFDLDQYLRYWAAPQYLVTGYIDKKLVAAYFAVTQQAELNDKAINIAGLGGLVCSPYLRSRGFASKLITYSWPSIVTQHQADVSLLICNEKNVGFYESFGWQPFDGSLSYEKTEKSESFRFNVLAQRHSKLVEPCHGKIHIDGPLW